MTKKKNIFVKLFVALVALTLISCCFLGSTFARYTSGDDGSATVNVAKWDVNDTLTGGTAVEFGSLSPSQTGYAGASKADVSNTTGEKLIGMITNSGAVNATVTFAVDSEQFKNGASDASFDATGYSWAESALSGNGASQAQVEALFSVNLYWGTEDTWKDEWATSNAITVGGTTVSLNAGAQIYIFAEVVWTTSYSTDSESQGALCDAVDTWVGQNVTSVVYGISYTAVQASELPTA